MFAPGEKISEEKLAKKILWSLSKRFDMKVTSIEEAQDINTIKLDELIISLITFETTNNDKWKMKNKGVPFKVDVENDECVPLEQKLSS